MANSDYFSTHVTLEPSGKNKTLSPKKNGKTNASNEQEFLFHIGQHNWAKGDEDAVEVICSSVSGNLQEKGSHDDHVYPVIGKQTIKVLSIAFDYPSQKVRVIAEPAGDVRSAIPVIFSGIAVFTPKPDWFADAAGDKAEADSSTVTKSRNFVSK